VGIKGELPSPVNPPSGCRFPHQVPVRAGDLRRRGTAATVIRPGHVAACHFPLQNYVPPGTSAAGTASEGNGSSGEVLTAQ
jgi:peptide/nickel transport system ATP-binding protein